MKSDIRVCVYMLQIVAWRIRWSLVTLYSAASAVTVSFTRSALVAVSFNFVYAIFYIHYVSFVVAELCFCLFHLCSLIQILELISDPLCR